MGHWHETAAYVTDLCTHLLACATKEELDNVFDQAEIELALDGYPDDRSDAIVLYALNMARIERDVPDLPVDALDELLFGRAVTRLAMVYLSRIGFLTRFEEDAGRVAWRCNPLHPLVQTMDRLEKRNHALWVVAREAWTNTGPDPAYCLS